MEFVLTFIAVAISCPIYHWIHNHLFTEGTLKIDSSNPDKDVYRFEIDHLDNISNKKRIVLKIDPNADLSQE